MKIQQIFKKFGFVPISTTDKYNKIFANLAKIYESKSADYGTTAHDLFVKYGEEYYTIMVEQKITRINNLSNAETINNESLRDSWADIANYAILRLLEDE